MRELTAGEVTGLTLVCLFGLVVLARIAIDLISMIGEVIQRSFEAGNVEYNDCTFEGLKPAKTDAFAVSIPSHIPGTTHDDTDPEADCECSSLDPSDPGAGSAVSPR